MKNVCLRKRSRVGVKSRDGLAAGWPDNKERILMTGVTEYRKQLAGELPGWEVVPTAHPRMAHPADGDKGVLVRHQQTGRYCLALGGSLRSVPQRWAAQQDQEQ